MSKNLSKVALVANEIAKAVDFTFGNDQTIANTATALQAILSDGNSDYVIGGRVKPYPSGGMNFVIEPIYGHCRISGVDVVEAEQTKAISVETADASADRIDTIQIRGVETPSDFQQRKFRDPETEAITTDTIPTKTVITLDVTVKKGANGSVTAPHADNGYIKLAELVIPAGTVSITEDNIRNISARASGIENNEWTIDKGRTFNPGYLSDVIAKFLTAHNEDGTHKGNQIKAANLKLGIETGDVNGKIIPIGESLAIKAVNFTSQVSMTDIIVALALTVNAAYPYANNVLGRYAYTPDLPVAASTENVNITAGGEREIDGIACTVGQIVFLKDQTNPKENGFWEVQTGAWNRYAGYTNVNVGCLTHKFVLVEAGTENAGKVFYLENDTYAIGDDNLIFRESIFSPQDLPGKVMIRDKDGRTSEDDKREAALKTALLNADSPSDMVDGVGRNLLEVLGVNTIPEAMAEIRRRCNNNGEINSTKIPDFSGIKIGDYIDGLDLSNIAAPNSGAAPQAWNSTYKNNRILVSGFNTYKNAGDTENTENHILFTFRHCIAKGRINSSDTNTGGYQASEARIWLEGASGDGSGVFAMGLKAALGGNFLYTIRKAHSKKGAYDWNNYTVWLPTEVEVWGRQTYGDELNQYNTNIHLPIFQKGYAFLIKCLNGARNFWWNHTPYAANTSYFCTVNNSGNAHYYIASITSGGFAPAFCVR
jgi:hypothetical protein